MKTYLNIFFLFLILCTSCGSRKANDNKGTTLQADTVKKFTLPIIPSGTALLGQYGFYRYHLY